MISRSVLAVEALGRFIQQPERASCNRRGRYRYGVARTREGRPPSPNQAFNPVSLGRLILQQMCQTDLAQHLGQLLIAGPGRPVQVVTQVAATMNPWSPQRETRVAPLRCSRQRLHRDRSCPPAGSIQVSIPSVGLPQPVWPSRVSFSPLHCRYSHADGMRVPGNRNRDRLSQEPSLACCCSSPRGPWPPAGFVEAASRGEAG